MMAAAKDEFWRWSLDHYQQNGVESSLLTLQDDFDFNINILLWACWCAVDYETLPELALRKAIDLTGQWSANVTTPIRRARRYLKTPTPQTDTSAEHLRSQIKEAELAAEHIEQSILQSLAETALKKQPTESVEQWRTTARRNLAAYATLTGAPRINGFSISLLESLIDHIFAPTPAIEAKGLSS